jgi:hypothetical protein
VVSANQGDSPSADLFCRLVRPPARAATGTAWRSRCLELDTSLLTRPLVDVFLQKVVYRMDAGTMVSAWKLQALVASGANFTFPVTPRLNLMTRRLSRLCENEGNGIIWAKDPAAPGRAKGERPRRVLGCSGLIEVKAPSGILQA